MNISNAFMAWVHTRFVCKIKGKSNAIIEKPPLKISNCKIRVSGRNNKIIIEPGAVLRGTKIVVSGQGHTVTFGPGFTMYGGGEILVTGQDGGDVTFGPKVELDAVLVWAVESRNISIGEDSMVGRRSDIRTSDSHPIIDLESGQRINPPQDVVIGERVWVGAHAAIMKGSVLEDDSIVALGAIVSGKVEKNSIVAGIPARKVKSGIRWTR